jgi:hypothetical protein
VTTVIRAAEPPRPAAAGPLRAGYQLLLLSRATGEADVETLFRGGGGPPQPGPSALGAGRRGMNSDAGGS